MAKVRQALSDIVLNDYSDTRVTTMGYITEVVTMQKRCVGPPVVRITSLFGMNGALPDQIKKACICQAPRPCGS